MGREIFGVGAGEQDGSGGEIESVEVGGSAVTVARGEFHVP